MTETQKRARYCIPCNRQGTHTSLDFGLCPKKREIIRERTREARRQREKIDTENMRDVELIKKVIDLSEREWPSIQRNTQHNQISTIITLALIDEAVNPGVFQDKLTKACEDNNIQKVKYTLQPNIAKEFYNALTGKGNQVVPRTSQQAQIHQVLTETPKVTVVRGRGKAVRGRGTGRGTHIIRIDTSNKKTGKNMQSKYFRDNMKGSGQLDFEPWMDNIEGTNRDSDLEEKANLMGVHRPEPCMAAFRVEQSQPSSQGCPPNETTEKSAEKSAVVTDRNPELENLFLLAEVRSEFKATAIIMSSYIDEEISTTKTNGTAQSLKGLLENAAIKNTDLWKNKMLGKLEALIKQGHGGAIIPYSTYFSLVTETEKGTKAIQSESLNSSPEAQQSENLSDWDITEATEAIQLESMNSSPEAQQAENLN